MKTIAYLVRVQVKNWILNLRKKPGMLILYLFLAAMVVFMFMMPIDRQVTFDASGYFTAVVMLGFYLLMYFSIRRGMERGGSFFSMADVNLLFTAPVRSTSVLLYGILRKMVLTLIGSLVIVYQTANLRNLFGLDNRGILYTIGGFFLLTFITVAVNICVYSITAVSVRRRKIGQRILDGLVAVLAVSFLVYMLPSPSIDRAVSFAMMPVFRYIPICGWAAGFVLEGIAGSPTALLFLAGNIAVLLISFAYMARAGTDYYEDVLTSTEEAQAMVERRRSGNVEAKPSRFGRKPKTFGINRGSGASTFLYKQILEQKRRGFLFFDGMTALHVFIAILAGIFLRDVVEAQPYIGYFLVAVGAYLAFFLSFRSPWMQELTKPYIFLVPESPLKKLVVVSAFAPVKALLDGLLATLALLILLEPANPLPYILFPIAYATIQAVYAAGSMLAQKIADGKSAVISSIAFMLTNLLVVAPGLVLFYVIFMNAPNSAPAGLLAYVVLCVWNALCYLGILYLCRGMLHEMESASQ